MSRLPVRLAGISHRFGSVTALDDVSLEIRPGEFMTLLGPSGSGKTTLLRIIGGLIPQSAGRVWIGEREVTDIPAEQRDIGFVFQNYALFPHLNVRENVAFPLRLRKRAEPEIRRRVDEALGLVQMTHLAERQAAELSGGQQQRVALARAIVFHPTVLLMDEPLGALDKRLRQQVGLEVRRLQRELGITAIYVTHDQEEAFTMSDRIAVMNHGAIRQLASPEEIYRHPVDEFTADFVGDLNRFEGELIDVADGVARFRTADGIALRARRAEAPQQVTIGIRPENIVVGANRPPDNQVTALVRTVVFLGGIIRLELALSSGRVLIADLRDNRWHPREGDSVAIGWDEADCLVFKRSGAD